MKTSKPSVRNVLLAAVLALPLFVMGNSARADEMGAGRPPMAQGEHGPHGPEHDGPGPFAPGFGPGRPPFFHGLDLSEAQQDKVFAIVHAEAPYLREQSKAAAKAREALRALASADKYDDAKAAALAKDLATAEANLALQHVRTQQKLLAVLTPEQRNKQADEKPRHPQRP
ncbi:protein refolding chaperone Spy/CpxP family [Duganella sp. CF402]|uniref:Spy/CpxP family protein refolding chaperone n=1 Tax=unclassified Duganella TaxID=2636909 RepID=UPI0008CF8AE7|nr:MULTISPECIES: periplasmic heavy metal sensor [unclassified Duganella]RZT10693.1 Spy/CpxP family protein refolding chaperone [Duganella sp. BK701]SEL01681.1 protein refolding chaperone Spy/CpxP family [Duganella sp. CF402]